MTKENISELKLCTSQLDVGNSTDLSTNLIFTGPLKFSLVFTYYLHVGIGRMHYLM